MKYFTKEWYKLCKKISFHLPLEEEKQAETFSEEYFQQLYKRKLWDYIEHKPFDREKATEQFYNKYIYKQEYIKNGLPENILNEIADIRVFVLDKATHNIIDAVTQFCEQNKKSINRTIEEYRKYYKKALKSFDENMVENIRFHDCMIVKSNKKDKSLILLLDNKGGFTDINEVTFENYNIIKQDGLLENSWWLSDEIYKVNDKYELHALLQNKNMDLIEFIISVEHIAFNSNKNN